MIDEPSLHRLKSMHYRSIELDNYCMDALHHLIYEADTVEVDFETVEDTVPLYKAMKLMGKAVYQGEKLAN